MKKVIIIANYVNFSWEKGNCRFIYLLNNLDCCNNEIELITTNFCHYKKEKRKNIKKFTDNLKYKVTLINEPGYKKNISLKRIYSHYVLGINLKKYLLKLKYKPDVIYCAVPSLDIAKVATQYAKKNNIKLIIDIQDLWPEAFKMVFKIPVLSDIIFFPVRKKAEYIYSNADEIVAVSETYVNRALEVNKKTKNGTSVFLGTDLDIFDKYAKENRIYYYDNIIRIVYIGTLGMSYDIKSVIDAIKILNDKGIKNIKFVVMGDGPLKQEFEEYAEEKQIDTEFTGRLEYEKMVGLLCSCDIAVNPIIGTSVASIINKVGDYAAAGIPVINTQNSQEYIDLLVKYHAGLNCKPNNSSDIANKLEYLIINKKELKELGAGNRKLAEELFDRKKTYKKIISLI